MVKTYRFTVLLTQKRHRTLDSWIDLVTNIGKIIIIRVTTSGIRKIVLIKKKGKA